MTRDTPNPFKDLPVLQKGMHWSKAKAAMILLHGRGGQAQDILSLTSHFHRNDLCYLAPQAPGSTWYPHRFIEPLEKNEPDLSKALALINQMLSILFKLGYSSSRVFLLGFSQGACLSLEYIGRHPQPYLGIIALSGGLIGPLGEPLDSRYHGSLAGTPVLLGCSRMDPLIPFADPGKY